MTGPAAWPHLRRKPERLGRHRKLPVVTESQMPPVTPASLPQHDYRASMPLRPIAVATAVEAEPEPDKIVECGFCHVSGLSSQMTSIGGGQFRCDLRRPDCECVQRNIRWRETGAKPAPILSSPLESLPEPEAPVLPPAQEEALAAFESAHAEQAAAEGKERSEDEEPDEAVTEPPAVTAEPAEDDGRSWLDKLADASLRAAEAKFGPMPPAPVAAEDVAEDAPEGEVQQ